MVLITRSDAYLEHHGILKQKWGVRHGPPYPLDYNDHSPAQKKANHKSELNNYENNNPVGGRPASGSDSSAKSTASEEKKSEKVAERSTSTGETKAKETESKKDEKTASSSEAKKTDQEKQSLHDRRKARLMEKGLTEEEAENQIKFENRAAAIVAVTAVALGAGATYALVRQHNMDSDFTLKGGTDMFRVSTNSDASVQDMFYATTNKADSRKYAGMYAKQLNGEMFGAPNGKDVYQKMLSPKSDVRIAGGKTGERVFNELCNDANFLRAIDPDTANRYGDAKLKALAKAGYFRYDAFNKNTLMEQKNSGAAKMFFDALQKEGYGGIIDINDSKFSGYEANRPVILFNQKSNINVNSVKKLSKETIESNYNFAMKRIAGQQFLANTGMYSQTVAELGAFGLIAAGRSYTKSMDNVPIDTDSSQKTKKTA